MQKCQSTYTGRPTSQIN